MKMVDYYALRLLQTAVELPIRCELEYEDPPIPPRQNAPELLELSPEARLTKPATSHTGLLPISCSASSFGPGLSMQIAFNLYPHSSVIKLWQDGSRGRFVSGINPLVRGS